MEEKKQEIKLKSEQKIEHIKYLEKLLGKDAKDNKREFVKVENKDSVSSVVSKQIANTNDKNKDITSDINDEENKIKRKKHSRSRSRSRSRARYDDRSKKINDFNFFN